MRIVVDTNVIASAIFFGGKPYQLLRLLAQVRIFCGDLRRPKKISF